jgi:hypothetical protein
MSLRTCGRHKYTPKLTPQVYIATRINITAITLIRIISTTTLRHPFIWPTMVKKAFAVFDKSQLYL